ncbi:collagen-like protein [Pseudomonas sp. DTU_2021_1001937_2_SI_NGA_ILE_001]|uniref:collagen-like protein n=1 Tax=Pseudomonas sp. DTU_2021_1001937_2_SI_NGA_ILE_001 TaxID=3077589 RepID=UPI0028FC0E73|nr:collagen-like protein [Pseudomonas sp. DTU_2021_1001937_2_SI_NGA_ILE_001]WNW11518.1 collagen-like protein [Pseudomonas sp. DTU_2021_1001937_2_SI_NGA_ILE_001]
MRKLLLLAALCSPLAMAQDILVQSHSLLRLPAGGTSLDIQRLEVADYGTLLVPGNITELKVGQLVLGHEARIAIVPSAQPLSLQVGQGQLGSGSQITARGAPGTFEKAPTPGRSLTLRMHELQAERLSVDARGGTGAPGFVGLDGANGQAPGCTWGQAGRGYDGDNGGNGHDGAAGGLVRLELPVAFPAERIEVNVQGGAGGAGGEGGKAGRGGESKGCIVYRAAGGKAGNGGQAGQAGMAGPAGAVNVQRF